MGDKISKIVLLNNCSQRDYQNLREVIIEVIKAGKTKFTFWGMKGRIEGQVIEVPEEHFVDNRTCTNNTIRLSKEEVKTFVYEVLKDVFNDT